MAIQTAVGGSGLVDVLDRVLDKGIVIDAWARVSLVGIEILGIETRVVVASVDTYLKYASAIAMTTNVARPQLPQETMATPLLDRARSEAAFEPRRQRAKAGAPARRGNSARSASASA